MRKLFLTALLICSMSVTAFAANGNRIPLTPTVTPLRIFFAALAVIGFIFAEIYIEKKREQRVKERPERAKLKAEKAAQKKQNKNKKAKVNNK